MAGFSFHLSVTSCFSPSFLCAHSAPASSSGPASGSCSGPEKLLQAPPGVNLPHDFDPGGANILKLAGSYAIAGWLDMPFLDKLVGWLLIPLMFLAGLFILLAFRKVL
jgi:hypothetical protein